MATTFSRADLDREGHSETGSIEYVSIPTRHAQVVGFESDVRLQSCWSERVACTLGATEASRGHLC
jgi:hypothetical protein